VSLVLDSSATLAWIYQDEVSDLTRQIFERVANSRAWVPAIWRLEVANGLQTGVRRGRIDAAYRALALGDLALLDISIGQDTDKYAWSSTLGLADRFRLTLYDAAYPELAQRRSLPLAALDEELRVGSTCCSSASRPDLDRRGLLAPAQNFPDQHRESVPDDSRARRTDT
jgi:predicted nucleic acid-binding protein